ncbi:hypothetical protein P4G96_16060, partial [Bacillus cereus]|nr:hypothetical protein [Bacillus cereus]
KLPFDNFKRLYFLVDILPQVLLFSVHEFYLLPKMYVRFLEEKNLFIMNSSVKTLIPILYRIFFEFWREF